MLRVNLNMLLAERSLTASRLAKDTGISKTTLSSLVNNTGKGIQYDTIDNICNYLNITPDDFFDYVPFEYSLSYYLDDLTVDIKRFDFYEVTISGIDCTFDFFIDIKGKKEKRTFELQGVLDDTSINLEFIESKEFEKFTQYFYNVIPEGHKLMFNNEVKTKILDNLKNDLATEVESLDDESLVQDLKNIDFTVFLDWDLPF